MSELAHKELNLEKYRCFLQIASGQDCPVAFCDAGGSPVWTSDGSGHARIVDVLSELEESGFEWCPNAKGRRCQEIDAEDLLFHEPVRVGGHDVGWIAVIVRRPSGAASAERIQRVEGTLGALATCLAEEYRLNQEVNSLAGELSQRYEELNLVYSLDAFAEAHHRGSQEGFRPLLENVATHVGVELAAFVEVGPRKPVYATAGGKVIRDLDLVLVEIRGDIFRFVCMSRQPLILNRPTDPRRKYLLPHMPYKFLAAPVLDNESVRGVLMLVRQDDRADFSNSDRSLAKVVADQLGVMLRNRAMLEGMRKFGEQMAGALIEAVEAKDPYTRGHSERVQAVSVHVGEALGLPRADLEDLFWGSIMHDIGKIAIPDVILSKPGLLTADEYTFIKTHPERSYEILHHIEYLNRSAQDGARYHHERFDGGGYPMGLEGKGIPLAARVIAVADTYDAMTTSRSYRPAMSHEDAIAEIVRVSGRQLDPEVVSAFHSWCQADPDWLRRITFEDEFTRG
jgi:HD-GYP domain-containing protein (c-di-GMP phosphodiesterase class II)